MNTTKETRHTKGSTASALAHWTIELRDGALQFQRAFQFDAAATAAAFRDSLRNYLGDTAFKTQIECTSSATIVTIHTMPERPALHAAGQLVSNLEAAYANEQVLAA